MKFSRETGTNAWAVAQLRLCTFITASISTWRESSLSPGSMLGSTWLPFAQTAIVSATVYLKYPHFK
ncbi:MAG: hypothetical protein RIF36_08085 [Imperialibacter sp.]|uniref:hypothetical protein n=1 Tax=Imperialibacter sp. TaxID=2038411 RepID=UPI0032F02D90